ncbi:hypothetical protein H0H81_000455 [Sphagnurus paluster]|uniref:DUF6593 domain-containing protein n=1 Tax=Sphagnurus paluster TaxID=117069 RepID=A0A9P7GMR7_9AGAR|nr:hypothetical protein H0H81_000455 [Sphagnurus paluster]
MDLCLVNNDPSNTLLVAEDGPRYEIDTDKAKTTTIVRIEGELILNDNSNTLLARYRRAKLGIVSRSRKAFLEVLPAGLSVVDLIVVTFVSFVTQRMAIDYHHDHAS